MKKNRVAETLLCWHEDMNSCPLYTLGSRLENGKEIDLNLVEDAKFKLMSIYDGDYGHELDMADCWEIENVIIWLNKCITNYSKVAVAA